MKLVHLKLVLNIQNKFTLYINCGIILLTTWEIYYEN